MTGAVYFDHHHEEWVGEHETRNPNTGEIRRQTAWFRHRYQAEEFMRGGVVNEDARIRQSNEHAYFIRDHGVLHQVDPLTKPHRGNPTVLVRAQKHGTIMRVPVSDLIRDY